MVKRVPHISIPDEVIMSKIYLIRGQKVMLDREMAELYKVETKQLKKAVRKNIERILAGHDAQIISILDYMGQLEEARQQEQDQKNRRRIGFKFSKSTDA